MDHSISRLVDRGEIDAALLAVKGLTPERVRQLLFSGDGFMINARPYGEFIARWYASLSSPYLRAEAADWFAQAYLTEIADIPHAEHLGALMSTESKRHVLEYLAETAAGKDLEDWAASPERPLSQKQLEGWKKISRQLRGLSFP